jgi:hypothetical protein
VRTAKPKTLRVEFRATRSERARWRLSAAIAGLTLSEWLRRACNEQPPLGLASPAALELAAKGRR